ncbi:YtxH domain-containing protein [Granulicella arctica]|uniref:YtxH domain-containing protein n=1 Tax=Granulicella arctica TaxID=940613 RepID=UPI0021DFE4FC|nr:YtxH domain-containing protein [Granulicella arctica]
MNNKYLWFALGIGATFGAGIALLFAPQSGVKTRKQIGRGLDEAGDYLEDAGDYLKDQAEKLSTEAQKVIKQTTTKVNHLVDEAVDRSSGAVKSVTSMF